MYVCMYVCIDILGHSTISVAINACVSFLSHDPIGRKLVGYGPETLVAT